MDRTRRTRPIATKPTTVAADAADEWLEANDPTHRHRTDPEPEADDGRGHPSPPSAGAHHPAMRADMRRALTALMAMVSEREERVLRMRTGFGMPLDRECDLAEVGRAFGVTSNRVVQIEARAIRRLRHPSRSRHLRVLLESDHDDLRLDPPTTGPATRTTCVRPASPTLTRRTLDDDARRRLTTDRRFARVQSLIDWDEPHASMREILDDEADAAVRAEAIERALLDAEWRRMDEERRAIADAHEREQRRLATALAARRKASEALIEALRPLCAPTPRLRVDVVAATALETPRQRFRIVATMGARTSWRTGPAIIDRDLDVDDLDAGTRAAIVEGLRLFDAAAAPSGRPSAPTAPPMPDFASFAA